MYYQEKIINGILCYRHYPNDNWEEFSKEQLTQKLIVFQLEIEKLKQIY